MRCATATLGLLILAMTAGCKSPREPGSVQQQRMAGVVSGPATPSRPRPSEAHFRQGTSPKKAVESPAIRLASHQLEAGWQPVEPPQSSSLEDTQSDRDRSSDSVDDAEPLIEPELLEADGSFEDLALEVERGSHVFTLNQFEVMALQNSPIVQHGSARVTVAEGQQIQAGLYPNPVIGYHAVNIGNLNTAGRQAGFIQQRFVTGGKLALDREIAGHDVRSRQAELSAAGQKVLTDVRSHFYVAYIAQRREEQVTDLFRIASEVAKSSQQLLDAEQISENTLLQSEIELEQAQILKDNAINESAEAWRRLAVVVGNPDLPRAVLAGGVDDLFVEYELESLTAEVLNCHPLLAAASARVNRAQVAITRARRENVPDITFLADAARTNHTGFNTAQ
ncbi:MAG: TolC family protein, partial [Planctomycetaceae bacterium]